MACEMPWQHAQMGGMLAGKVASVGQIGAKRNPVSAAIAIMGPERWVLATQSRRLSLPSRRNTASRKQKRAVLGTAPSLTSLVPPGARD